MSKITFKRDGSYNNFLRNKFLFHRVTQFLKHVQLLILRIYQWTGSCQLLRVDAASKTARYYGGVVTICLSLPVNLCTWMHWRHRAICSYSLLVFIDSDEIGGYDNNLSKIVLD